MAQDIEDKVAKLLAMAEGTTNPHEAETFMAKAEELMLQYGIERAQLAAKRPGAKREEIVTVKVTIPNGHGYADAMVQIAFAVAPSFSIKAYKSNLPDGGRVAWFVGHKSDVDQAEMLFNSLLIQSKAQAVAWWRSEGKQLHPFYSDNDAYLARREFIYAFASGVRSRLGEIRNRVVAEAEAGTALVLVDREKFVDQWVRDNMTFGRARSTQRRAGSYNAATAGHRAGREAVNTKAVK